MFLSEPLTFFNLNKFILLHELRWEKKRINEKEKTFLLTEKEKK